MLAQIQAGLEPWQLIAAGVLFLNLCWLRGRCWLTLGAFALSAAEIAPLLPWSNVFRGLITHTQIRRIDIFTGLASGDSWPAGVLLINALLAVLMFWSIRRLQQWARVTVARNEAAFQALVGYDAGTRYRPSRERGPD